MRHVAALLLILLPGHAPAQRISTAASKCSLKTDRSPTVRGFKLGMTRAQTEKAFGDSINYVQSKADSTGAASVAGHQYPEKLGDVTSVKMNVFTKRLYAIEIVYAAGEVASGPAVTADFSKVWNLPASAWESDKTYINTGSRPNVEHKEVRVLYCAGWGMAAQVQGIGNPKIEVSQFGVDTLIAQKAARIRGAGQALSPAHATPPCRCAVYGPSPTLGAR